MQLHLLQLYFLIISDQNVQAWLCPVTAALAELGVVVVSVMNLSENPTVGFSLGGKKGAEYPEWSGEGKKKKPQNICFFSPFLAVSMLQCC